MTENYYDISLRFLFCNFSSAVEETRKFADERVFVRNYEKFLNTFVRVNLEVCECLLNCISFQLL